MSVDRGGSETLGVKSVHPAGVFLECYYLSLVLGDKIYTFGAQMPDQSLHAVAVLRNVASTQSQAGCIESQ